MKLLRQKLFSSLDPSIVLEFLGRLSGFVSRAKSLHWAAAGKDIHEYLDDLWKELYEFQDTVAEGFMGISGQFSAQDVPYVASEERRDPQAFIKEVEDRTLEFYEELPTDDPRYKGLCGETESFIQTIEKYKYLFSLCSKEKEFSDNEDKVALSLAGTGAGAGVLGALNLRGYKKSVKALETAHPEKTKKEISEAIKKAGEGLKKLGLSKRQSRLEDKVGRIKFKTGEITKEELEKILDKGKHAREDIAESIKKSEFAKAAKQKKNAKIALLTSGGLLLTSAGIGLHKRSKNKQSNNE